MQRQYFYLALAALVMGGAYVLATISSTRDYAMADETAGSESGKMLAHMVYFSLNDPTPENKEKVIAAAHKFLTGHPGTVFYAAGTCADYNRPVNDRDFDVALQLVFKDHAAHDAYQDSPRHKEFIAACAGLWKKVRVFDSDLSGSK